MTLTKTVQNTVFDSEKIGIGDVIEFVDGWIKKPFGTRAAVRKVGVVLEVTKDRLEVAVADTSRNHPLYHAKNLRITPIYIQQADDIRMIYKEVARP